MHKLQGTELDLIAPPQDLDPGTELLLKGSFSRFELGWCHCGAHWNTRGFVLQEDGGTEGRGPLLLTALLLH
jgi:hypothetical protein